MARWGMVIDLDRCTGCAACEVACKSENNIAAVSADEADMGRASSWMKVMAHVEGEFPDTTMHFYPRPCMHCDNPPCIRVCPVQATYIDDEGIELMIERGTFLVPTLLPVVAVLESPEASASIPEYGLRKLRQVSEVHAENIGRAYRAGVKIAMGTDAGVMPHGTNLRELDLMCQVGMSPMESIVATTKTAAECLGWEDRLGTLERGKLADVVVCAADPLADISSLADVDNIKLVMQGGRVLKKKWDAD